MTLAGGLPKWSDTPVTLAGRLPGLSDTPVMLAGRLPGLSDTPVMLAGRLPGLSDTLVVLAGRLPGLSDTLVMLAGRLPENFSRLSPPVSSVFPPYPQCSINPWRRESFRRLLLPKETASAGSCAGLLQSNYATSYPKNTMQIILVDGKAWERHRSAFADFIHRIERLIGNPPEVDEWLDNDAVCRRLNISPRTLQTLRDTGKIPFSMVGHKCYYRAGDIADLLNSKAE